MSYPDQTRNLDPHKPAVVATFLYGSEYAKFGGGSMDFWDQLHPIKQRICRSLIENANQARDE